MKIDSDAPLSDRVADAPERLILDKLPVAAVLHDGEGTVVWANASAQRLLSPVARPGIRLPPRAALALGRVKANRQPQCDLVEHATLPDGSSRWLKVDIVPIGERDGHGFLTTLTDITESEHVRRRSLALMSLVENMARNVTNYQATLHTLARETAELIGDGVLVTILSPDGRWLQRVASYHRNPVRRAAGRELLGQPYPTNEGPAGLVVKSGRPLRVDSFQSTAELGDKYAGFVRQFDIRCLVIVPLLAEGRVLGTLGTSRDTPPYTDDDVSFLQSLADSAALTILNARLHAEASQRLQRLASLHQTDMAAVSSLDLRLTLQVLLEQIRSGLNLQRVAICAADPLTGEQMMIAAVGEGWSRSTQPQFVENGQQRVTVPLVSRGRHHGSLELYSATPFQLDGELSQFLETLAARAALAIENRRCTDRAGKPVAPTAGARAGGAGLTPQQQRVFQLAGQGESNRQIAQKVKLSENTVKFHLRQIYRKLRLRNRVELARLASGPET